MKNLLQRFIFSDKNNIFINMFFNENQTIANTYLVMSPKTATIDMPCFYLSGRFNKNDFSLSIFEVKSIDKPTIEQINKNHYVLDIIRFDKKTNHSGQIIELKNVLLPHINAEIMTIINKEL